MENMTIKKIAEMGDVSVSAVSYVLNGKKGVSDKTRAKILRIIEEVNYTPNVNSRRLILNRSFNLLICLDTGFNTLDNLFYTEVINAIVERAAQHGYRTVLSTDGVSNNKERLLEILHERNADGVLFLRDIPSSLYEQINRVGAPCVVVDSHRPEPPYPCIQSDIEIASYVAVRYLIQRGHRRIAYLGMSRIPDMHLRSFEGYRRALSEAGLTIHPDWVQNDAFDEPSAQKCAERIAAAQLLPTAVFCAGDIFAIGAMNYFQDHSYRVPEDFSIVSVDDIIMSQYYHPALSTVHIDKQQMGTAAVEMLDALITQRDTERIVVIPSGTLIERNSVRTLGGLEGTE